MDNELFELCKEVYERTGWSATKEWIREDGLLVDYNVWDTSTPLYTSDYLLEKLPLKIKDTYWFVLAPLDAKDREWEANYYRYSDDDNALPFINADTPLKAILKLVIALDDAGVKL